MFASILSVAHNLGYPALVLLVMSESSGVPLPGETALITGAVLASQHRLQIALVIALAAAAAILGDNAGYLIGRKGGRWLLQRPGPFARHRARVLEVGEPFFARHGAKAVFLGRWILGLRTWASWLAGASHMPWRSFSLWNAASDAGDHLALAGERHAAAHRGVSSAGDGEEGIEGRAWLHEGDEVSGAHADEGGRVGFSLGEFEGERGRSGHAVGEDDVAVDVDDGNRDGYVLF
jgi:membrane protein DedA with SNARE-associated domain